MMRRFGKGLAAALAALCAPLSLHAQSCALCYQTASASSPQFIQALRYGIVALLIPSVFIGATFSVLAYRRRGESSEADGLQPPVGDSIDITR